MVDSAVVRWAEVAAPLHDLEKLEEDGDFYAVVSAVPTRAEWKPPFRLLYLGLAYHQTVPARIKQIHASYARLSMYYSLPAGRKVIVMVGSLMPGEQSVERITREFCEDVEALLIYGNRPKANKMHMASYRGRPLIVTCEGNRAPLRHRVASSPHALTRWENDGA